MLKRIFPFLKRNLTQDPLLINRIFVTLYITYNNVSTYNSFVSRYIINNGDEDYNPKFRKMRKKVCPLCANKEFSDFEDCL